MIQTGRRYERKTVPQKKKRVYYHGYRGATSMDELLADFKKKMGWKNESKEIEQTGIRG
jgi:succinate dehydrogenase flavin-adding protein (antitoxin of CptAB toxin-antitoxin module)